MKRVYIGQWVRWHSKTRKRYLQGVVTAINGSKATIIWTTFDGRGHHWTEPVGKLHNVPELNTQD